MTRITDLNKSEISELIDEWVICRRNAKRNREIYKRALFDGVSQERIAEEFNLTPRQIQYIIKEVDGILLEHLNVL